LRKENSKGKKMKEKKERYQQWRSLDAHEES